MVVIVQGSTEVDFLSSVCKTGQQVAGGDQHGYWWGTSDLWQLT